MKIQYLVAFAATILVSTAALAQPAGGPPAGMSMPGMGAMGPTQVGVITLKSEAAPITTTLPGRVVAWGIIKRADETEDIVESEHACHPCRTMEAALCPSNSYGQRPLHDWLFRSSRS